MSNATPKDGSDEPPESVAPSEVASSASSAASAAAVATAAPVRAPTALNDSRILGSGLWLVAVIVSLAGVVARGASPALVGVWVGINAAISTTRLAAAVLTQMSAVLGCAVLLALAAMLWRGRASLPLRIWGVGTSALIMLTVMVASAARLPGRSIGVLTLSAALLAGMCALAAAPLYQLRAAALIVGAASVAAVARFVGALPSTFVSLADNRAAVAVAAMANVVYTLTFGLVVALAVAWMITQPSSDGKPPGSSRFAVIGGAAIVALALIAVARLGLGVEAAGVPVLTVRSLSGWGRALQASDPIRMALSALGWATIAAVLVARPRSLALSAAVALAVGAAAAPESPLGLAAMALAALALAQHGTSFDEAFKPATST